MVLEGTSHKVPKVAAAAIALIRDALTLFGARCWPSKVVLGALKPWFEHSAKVVRDEAFALVVEMHRWLGPNVARHIDQLRSAQVKELSDAFASLPTEPPVPSRTLRSQAGNAAERPQSSSHSSDVVESDLAVETVAMPDNYELAEPHDVLSRLSSSFIEDLAASQWKVRKEQLEALVPLLDVPRLRSGDYWPLSNALTRVRLSLYHLPSDFPLQVIKSDANVFCVELACKAVGLLGRGLRKDFAVHARDALPALMDKFKEKKASVITAIHDALAHWYPWCVALTDAQMSVTEALASKVPAVRLNALSYFATLVKLSSKAILAKHHKTFVPAILAVRIFYVSLHCVTAQDGRGQRWQGA